MKKSLYIPQAPEPIGPYSCAIHATGSPIYICGQIALDQKTSEIIQAADVVAELDQIFHNLKVLTRGAGGSLDHIVKFTVYVTDMSFVSHVNEAITKYMAQPYPARTLVQVVALPKGARVEIDAIMVL